MAIQLFASAVCPINESGTNQFGPNYEDGHLLVGKPLGVILQITEMGGKKTLKFCKKVRAHLGIEPNTHKPQLKAS